MRYKSTLEKRINQKKWFDASNANAEKEIMISAFMVRKLFESKRIDKNIVNKSIPIIKFKSNGKRIHFLRRLDPDRYFDLEKPISDRIICKELINNIIHSYIFLLLFEETIFKWFWVSSDYNKFEYIIQIEVREYLKILKEVGEYWPNGEIYQFNKKLNDFEVIHNPSEEVIKDYIQNKGASDRMAENQGFFVIKATGSSSSIVNQEGFKPKAF